MPKVYKCQNGMLHVILFSYVITLLLLSDNCYALKEINKCPDDDFYVNESIIFNAKLDCFVIDEFKVGNIPRPVSGMPNFTMIQDVINEVHEYPKGMGAIIIQSSNIILDCGGTRIRGIGFNSNDSRTKARYGIFSNNVTNVTIKNCILEGFADAIMIFQSTGWKIYDNIFYNNDNGVVLDNTIPQYWEKFERTISQKSSPGYNAVINNIFIGNNQGVNLLFSNNNLINYNYIKNSKFADIQLENSSNNFISANYLGAAMAGILFIDGSNLNLIFNNTFHNISDENRWSDLNIKYSYDIYLINNTFIANKGNTRLSYDDGILLLKNNVKFINNPLEQEKIISQMIKNVSALTEFGPFSSNSKGGTFNICIWAGIFLMLVVIICILWNQSKINLKIR
jgi:hypothetical protein